MNTKQRRYSSLENALRLLDLFSIEKNEYRVNEIAAELQIANSTAHRLLTTLESEGFISKDLKTNSYRLGVSILSLSSALAKNMAIVQNSTALLQNITSRFKETSQLGVPQGDYVYYINKVDYEHPVFGHKSFLERKALLHQTAAGKVILAHQPLETIKKYADHHLASLNSTETTKAIEDLQQIVINGYACQMNTLHEDITSIAAPIYSSTHTIIGALELIGSNHSINEEQFAEITHSLKMECKKMEDSIQIAASKIKV